MEQLIKSTTAYALFSGDRRCGKLSHAYMLDFADVKNLRAALKIFALEFFGFSADSVNGRRILNESFTDCPVYPAADKKLASADISAILSDAAMRPLEASEKLFVIDGFEQASPLLQNKLLKTLEEPPEGVHFLLGVTTLAPVLDTVKSRVKTLTIPPFTEGQILDALERRGENKLNADAAKSCGGILGVAENMIGGGWFEEVVRAADEICTTSDISDVGAVAIKYGDTKYKAELLRRMQQNFRDALGEKVRGVSGKISALWQTATFEYALESLDKAGADLKFNAFFQGLLYDLMLRIIEENDRWLKLQE